MNAVTSKFMIIIMLVLSFSFAGCTQAQKEPVYSRLDNNIYEINNQYYYGMAVHTYLIELVDKVLLFDIPAYSKDIDTFIQSFNKPAVAVLSHGSCGIKDGETWQEKIGLQVYLHQGDADHPWLRMRPDVLFTTMPDFADNIVVIHTPGHSAGSVCVLEKNTKSLFTGDTFQGTESGGIRDFTKEEQEAYENVENRISSCRKLLNYDFENVYPFHYEMIAGNGRARLEAFLNTK